MQTRFPILRTKIEKAFVAWYAERETAFKRPLVLLWRKEGFIEFTQPGLNPSVAIYLSRYRANGEFGARADWQGKWWDGVINYEVAVERTTRGYFDRMTIPDYRVSYPRCEALWRNELFEPMLNWLNEKLANSVWLGLYTSESCGATWAERLDEPDAEATHCLPVWLDDTAVNASVPLILRTDDVD